MALLTDALAVVMVLFAVVGMLGVAYQGRKYEMVEWTEGVVVALGAALVVGMTVTTFF
ncbi:hypothetical protein U4E84_04615 [Halorubrum sp. AD140]|uniref:hypothetical protein n=1 Tax=Halorubrum sp. AD140 TaxID=3050073 RepID=UPI002ACC6FC7|nr:hypothetical protein [Halorubrum sp. AD140]MDZ5810628.1 hypothetical protein [Halorubrum sp. AD140]